MASSIPNGFSSSLRSVDGETAPGFTVVPHLSTAHHSGSLIARHAHYLWDFGFYIPKLRDQTA